ncbi:hypothetical protein SSX86_011866 [Deinandra increscens subsp. villosa]|uniref:Late embryogenesis abundant protein LEA-2 subgroup domain-containing protein n=1 Tax=Deinandra increscens subsp. villosa TaxID=3103831 RepID=A0AAP0H2P7_9ASTR
MHVKPKHDEMTVTAIPAGAGKSKRRRIICLSVSLTVLAAAGLLILILALTVFKSKQPITTVNSVAVKDVNATVNLLPVTVSVNISLDITISVKNPNRVGVTYRDSSAALRYRGREIGDVPIPGGKIGSGETKRLNLSLTVFADRLLSDVGDVYGDVMSGKFPLSSYTRISGRIRVLNMFNIHVSSTSTCDLKIDILNRKIVNQSCHYKNK